MARDPIDLKKVYALAVTGVLLLATLSPLIRSPLDDGFPLSTYPMFASKRDTKQTFNYPLGITSSGERRTLGSHFLDTGETLQALSTVDHAVSQGKKEMEPLCRRIAENVAADERFADVVTIRIVTGTHDAIDYLADDKVGPERTRFHCPVPR